MTASEQLRQVRRMRQPSHAGLVALVFCAGILAGCGTGGGLSALDDDPTLITGSITPAKPAGPSSTAPDNSFASGGSELEIESDRKAIVGMVIAADLDRFTEGGLDWRNVRTGSYGRIESLRRVVRASLICRQFTVSRQSYDGVALWTGEMCRKPQDDWQVTSFQKV